MIVQGNRAPKPSEKLLIINYHTIVLLTKKKISKINEECSHKAVN